MSDVLLQNSMRLHQSGDLAGAARYRANALLEVQRAREALADCERATGLEPNHPVLWNNRGNALCGLGRGLDAAESFEKAIALDPRYGFAVADDMP